MRRQDLKDNRDYYKQRSPESTAYGEIDKLLHSRSTVVVISDGAGFSRHIFIMDSVRHMNRASAYQRSCSTFAEKIRGLDTKLDNKLPPTVNHSFQHPYNGYLLRTLHASVICVKPNGYNAFGFS
ncbi:hypothetical protein RF11_01030 [Thelohanellus kitauei]|uniref:Uncharacterized protein n=1 Tax=Thelohanellus kitauei TaxID=669202 RepID=A0A0C2IBD3_THEKT|nr:hypothetical protein RF11_01030 [Thelohanellus kitauei]